jgi:hypothetical protein
MLFFGPALFGAACACRLAGVTIAYGAVLTRGSAIDGTAQRRTR